MITIGIALRLVYDPSSTMRKDLNESVALVTVVHKQTKPGIAGPKTLQDDVRRLLIPR